MFFKEKKTIEEEFKKLPKEKMEKKAWLEVGSSFSNRNIKLSGAL